MTPERWRRVKEVFDAALQQDGSARAALVVRAAADDPPLADEVLRLLASDEKAGAFLSAQDSSASLGLASGDPPVAAAGRHIGPYRVLSEIAHGGMGVVYRAVRDDDQYQKQVAIKLLLEGTGSEPVIERFKAERQILANLEHPNIARLIDGGTTDEGWPYFSMECVDGEPIDRYCESRNLSTRQRLELFLAVCSAVQYAHQSLVIHRDLKPGNIIVAQDGVPKLLDFGIAKLLTDAIQTRTLTGFPLMTPEYASPEQVKGQPITTASDVYSLGMLLYELLARRGAYQLESGSPEEIARVVCDVEPEKPSAVAPRPLSRQLAGDLDTIVLKALRKEPARRYPSVRELADDIQRHLSGRPVQARPDTRVYRISKFVGRHRVGVAAAALVFVSLVGGVVATAREARIAEANRARAERRFSDVRKLANVFLFDFHDAIKDLPGATKARELVVKNALEYLGMLANEAHGNVALQREVAAAYQRLGDVQGGAGDGHLGDTNGALDSYGKALALRRGLAASPADPRDADDLASIEATLARILVITGDLPRAEEVAGSAAARLEALAGKADSDRRNRLASVYRILGYIQARRGNETAALSSLEKAAAAAASYCETHPQDGDAQANLALVQSEMVERLGRAGEHRRAVELASSARTTLERLVAREPNNARYRRNLIQALNIGGVEMEEAGDLRSANLVRRRSVELAEALLAAEPGNRGDRIFLTYSLQGLGLGLVHGNDTRAGLEYLRRALRSAEVTVESDPGNLFTRNRVAEVQSELGLALHALGKYDREMCSALDHSVTFWEDLERNGRLPGESRTWRDRARAAFSACAHHGR